MRPQQLPTQILHRTGLTVGTVVEQHIQRAAGLRQYLIQRLPDRLAVVEIELQAFQPKPLQNLHILLPTRAGKDPVPQLLQTQGTVLADATGAPRNQNRFHRCPYPFNDTHPIQSTPPL